MTALRSAERRHANAGSARRAEPNPGRDMGPPATTRGSLHEVQVRRRERLGADAAKQLAELGVGAMPICGEDDRLKGMITDRDIVVKVVAEDKDPNSTKAGELTTSPRSRRSAPTTPLTRRCAR